jgi:hypothetical protein
MPSARVLTKPCVYVRHAPAHLQVDSFIVGLISIAIALPVTLFLQSCFEIANDNEVRTAAWQCAHIHQC